MHKATTSKCRAKPLAGAALTSAGKLPSRLVANRFNKADLQQNRHGGQACFPDEVDAFDLAHML